MDYREALVAWNANGDQVRVGRLLGEGDADWTRHPVRYQFTGGAAYTEVRECKDNTRLALLLFLEFHEMVVRDHVSIDAAHREFLKIDQYRRHIATDIKGAESAGETEER